MAATMGSMQRCLKEFSSLLEKPEVFLSAQPSLCKKLKTATKDVYDVTKAQEETTNASKGTLPRLIVKDFDEEQIWQELELQNSHSVKSLLTCVSGVLAKKDIHFKSHKELQEKKKKTNENNFDEEPSHDEDSDKESSDEEEQLRKIKARLEGNTDGTSSEDEGFDFGSSDLELGEEELMEENDVVEQEHKDHRQNRKLKYKSVVDDKFFKLCEMEEFLEQEDAREERRRRGEQAGGAGDESQSEDEEEEVDMFQEMSDDDEEGGDLKYEDFFDPPDDGSIKDKKRKKVNFSVEAKDSDDQDDQDKDSTSDEVDEDIPDKYNKKAATLSNFEKKQEKLKNRIKDLEQASLTEKSWQLTGEVTGPARPENSLLEEHLQFDVTTRAAPVITEETTKTLEDIIRQRIKDKAWDDVERKVKKKDDVTEYKKRITLDQEKSKQSLSDVYEQEYLKQQQTEKEEKEDVDPKHDSIRKSMRSLFLKLDALSNFHYTPKEAQPELRIVSNMPSIAMEEVAPVSVSDQKMLAPEEVKEKSRREEKGESERTQEDKKRDHREKKKEKRKRKRQREQREKVVAKMNPGLGNKYSKEKALKDLQKMGESSVKMIQPGSSKMELKSSTAFFSKLQDEVTTHIRQRKPEKKSKEKLSSSVKLKL